MAPAVCEPAPVARVCVCVSVCVCVCASAALIFDGGVNPAHPKHIGSIDPTCDVVEVVKGKRCQLPRLVSNATSQKYACNVWGQETHSLVAYHMTCTRVYSAHVISWKLSFISPLLDYAGGSGFHREFCVNAHMYI